MRTLGDDALHDDEGAQKVGGEAARRDVVRRTQVGREAHEPLLARSFHDGGGHARGLALARTLFLQSL